MPPTAEQVEQMGGFQTPTSGTEWMTEIPWAEEDILEAAELQRQVDAEYIAQMTALRTSAWVGHVSELVFPNTPLKQMYPSDDDQDGSAFSGFSGLDKSPSREEEKNDAGKVDDDPFETPSQTNVSSPIKMFDVPRPRPLIPDSFAATLAKRRGRQLSPCAFRSGDQADWLYNTLQNEVSTDR